MERLFVQLKKARQKAGLTQGQLAKLASVSQNDISKLERGMVDVRLSKLERIAEALNLDLFVSPTNFRTQVLNLIQIDEDETEQTLLDKYGVADDE